MAKKIPTFQRQDQHKKRLKKVWRRPRGRHSKVRLGKRGHQARVRIGYKVQTQKNLRIVARVEELKTQEGVTLLVSGKIGKKRKLEIAKEAQKRNVTLANLDVAACIKSYEEETAKKKALKKAKEESKKKEAQESKKKAELEKKVDEEEKKNTEEEKKSQKKERDKLLTQRERK